MDAVNRDQDGVLVQVDVTPGRRPLQGVLAIKPTYRWPLGLDAAAAG